MPRISLHRARRLPSGVYRLVRRFFSFRSWGGRARLALGVLLLFGGLWWGSSALLTNDQPALSTGQPSPRGVTLASFDGNEPGARITFAGTVTAGSEVTLTSKATGRITAVNVSLGQRVARGQVLATIENDTERAEVRRTEGVLEAARASAAQNQVSASQAAADLEAAKRQALLEYRAAYSKTNRLVITEIDTFFTNPEYSTIGVRISQGLSAFLRNSRSKLHEQLESWARGVQSLSSTDPLEDPLTEARETVTLTLEIFAELIDATDAAPAHETLDGRQLNAYTSELAAAHESLVQTDRTLERAQENIASARRGLIQAQVQANTAGAIPSAARAQITQAEASLNKARARLRDTIIQSPIAGTVQTLSVRAGDFVAPQTPIARVANTDQLVVTFYVNSRERDLLAVGDTLELETGDEATIIEIAPGVGPNGKYEVRAGTNAPLRTGETISVHTTIDQADPLAPRTVPLTAVRFDEAGNTVLFGVNEDNATVSIPVVIEDVRGNTAILSPDTPKDVNYIRDARGLTIGEVVSPTRE